MLLSLGEVTLSSVEDEVDAEFVTSVDLEPMIEIETLFEDVSIDGMCDVY